MGTSDTPLGSFRASLCHVLWDIHEVKNPPYIVSFLCIVSSMNSSSSDGRRRPGAYRSDATD